MCTRIFRSILLFSLLAGCAYEAVVEDIPLDHPANPMAPTSAYNPPPDALQRQPSKPITPGEPMHHDHSSPSMDPAHDHDTPKSSSHQTSGQQHKAMEH